MKRFLILFFPLVCFGDPLTVGNVPQVFTPTSLSNSPISISSVVDVNIKGATKANSVIGTNSVNFGGTLNGIASNVVNRIGGLTSDAQTQITANGASITANTASIVTLTSGLVTTSNRVETLNTSALAGLTTVSNGLTTTSNSLTTVTAGLVTTSNRVETVNGLNVKLAGDTMTGTLKVTGLTNSALTASRAIATDANKALVSSATTDTELGYVNGVTSPIQTQITANGTSITTLTAGLVTTSNRVETVNGLNVKLAGDTMTGTLKVTGLTNSALTANRAVATDANKASVSSATTDTELGYVNGVTSAIQTQLNAKQASYTVGTGLTNNGGTLSNNIVAGSNVTLTGGANGQITIAATSGGSGTVGTVINAGASVSGNLSLHTDTTGTNVAPSVATISSTAIGSVPIIIYESSTVINDTSSSSASNVVSFAVGANYLGTNKQVRVEIQGDFINNSASTTNLTITFQYGATAMWTSTFSKSATANRVPFVATVYLSAVNSTSSQILNGSILTVSGGAATVGTGSLAVASASWIGAAFEGTATEDSTASKNFLMTTTWASGASTCEFKVQRVTATLQ